MSRILEVSLSGYYDWVDRPKAKRSLDNEALLKEIKMIKTSFRAVYGYRRIYHALKSQNIKCSLNRVQRLMQQKGLKAKRRKPYKTTTNANHQRPVAPNLLDRNFTISRPDQVYISDITYIKTTQGWLYLATTIDLFSRRIVGWAMDDHMESSLVESALAMALWTRKPKRGNGLMHHSDRGVQYTSKVFQNMLKDHKITPSMSRKGNCWDNAVAESFFHTLKAELVYLCQYQTKIEAKQSIFEYIEVFYNQERLHSTLGYLSPAQFEKTANIS